MVTGGGAVFHRGGRIEAGGGHGVCQRLWLWGHNPAGFQVANQINHAATVVDRDDGLAGRGCFCRDVAEVFVVGHAGARRCVIHHLRDFRAGQKRESSLTRSPSSSVSTSWVRRIPSSGVSGGPVITSRTCRGANARASKRSCWRFMLLIRPPAKTYPSEGPRESTASFSGGTRTSAFTSL